MQEFTVKLKALTPIWTGGVDGENTTLRETSIIGSLRWWYEALIRGLGGTACDPTSDHNRCQLSGKEKQKTKEFLRCVLLAIFSDAQVGQGSSDYIFWITLEI